jgi:pseudouridine synthase
MPKIRLQKYCSEQGLASRRRAEEYIKNGWIKVNGQVVTELGVKVDPQIDVVEFSAKALKDQGKFQYILVNKPTGYVTNLPQAGEKEAKDLLPVRLNKLHAVGRLDKDSEGLLLFTDDGVVAHRLASPKFKHEKEYAVTVDQVISPDVLAKYRKGIVLAGEQLKPVEATKVKGTTYRFILREGKNRQIRRMLERFGYNVNQLKRVRIANLKLGELKPGKHRSLSREELKECQALLDL